MKVSEMKPTNQTLSGFLNLKDIINSSHAYSGYQHIYAAKTLQQHL